MAPSKTRPKKPLRLTRQREAVLGVLRATTSHPDAAEVYRLVRERLPGIGFATVYRTLNWLGENGLILELRWGAAGSRFDGNVARHDHAVCTRCGRVVDADVPLPEGIPQAAAQDTGFHIEGYRLEFYGRCPQCP